MNIWLENKSTNYTSHNEIKTWFQSRGYAPLMFESSATAWNALSYKLFMFIGQLNQPL